MPKRNKTLSTSRTPNEVAQREKFAEETRQLIDEIKARIDLTKSSHNHDTQLKQSIKTKAEAKKSQKMISREEPPPINEIPPWLDHEPVSDIEIAFQNKGVTSLWHMTHIDNLQDILKEGILSHSNAYKLKSPKDISDPSVQRWRNQNEPIFNKKIHEYTPTYINIKNPMLYKRNEIQDQICLIEISISILGKKQFIFSDGNAASKATTFYKDRKEVENLPWDVLHADYWSEYPDGKRKRCAEILIYPSIPINYISKIHVNTQEALKSLSGIKKPVAISPNLFFREREIENKYPPGSINDLIRKN